MPRREGDHPLRVVLGRAPDDARSTPLESTATSVRCSTSWAARGLQVLVEGGATVADDFHRAGLVDRYVLYLAPVLFGGDDARGLFAGPGAPTIDDVWRGRVRRRASATTSASTSTGARLMFTGIVEELGTVLIPQGSRAPDRGHHRPRRGRAG